MGRTSTAAFSWGWGRRTSPLVPDRWPGCASRRSGSGRHSRRGVAASWLLPAGGGLFEEAALPGTGCHPAHLPPRSDLDGAGPVPARGGGGYAAGSPAPDGPEAPGFAAPDGVLTGVETRSSSPVRILRDETFQSALRGLYPCGEGAGYAGGDRLRRRGRHPGGRGRGPGIKNKTRCPAGSAFLLGGEKRPVIPADPYER